MNISSLKSIKLSLLGINSAFGKATALLLKQSPLISRLFLYDKDNISIAHDLAEISSRCKISAYKGEEHLCCAVKDADVILIGEHEDCYTLDPEKQFLSSCSHILKYAETIPAINPNAIVLIAANPVNSLVPLYTEFQLCRGICNYNKILGVTAVDNMRANNIISKMLNMDPHETVLPVIGGSSPSTRIPLLSQSTPLLKVPNKVWRRIVNDIKFSDETVLKEKKTCEALNKAYATFRFVQTVISALSGEQNITQIAYVRNILVPTVQYISLPILLGCDGIQYRFHLPSLDCKEAVLLEHAIECLQTDIQRAKNYLSGTFPLGNCSKPMSKAYMKLFESESKNPFMNLLRKKLKLEKMESSNVGIEYHMLMRHNCSKIPPDKTPSTKPVRLISEPERFVPSDGCCPLNLPIPPVQPRKATHVTKSEGNCSMAVRTPFPPIVTCPKKCTDQFEKKCGEPRCGNNHNGNVYMTQNEPLNNINPTPTTCPCPDVALVPADSGTGNGVLEGVECSRNVHDSKQQSLCESSTIFLSHNPQCPDNNVGKENPNPTYPTPNSSKPIHGEHSKPSTIVESKKTKACCPQPLVNKQTSPNHSKPKLIEGPKKSSSQSKDKTADLQEVKMFSPMLIQGPKVVTRDTNKKLSTLKKKRDLIFKVPNLQNPDLRLKSIVPMFPISPKNVGKRRTSSDRITLLPACVNNATSNKTDQFNKKNNSSLNKLKKKCINLTFKNPETSVEKKPSENVHTKTVNEQNVNKRQEAKPTNLIQKVDFKPINNYSIAEKMKKFTFRKNVSGPSKNSDHPKSSIISGEIKVDKDVMRTDDSRVPNESSRNVVQFFPNRTYAPSCPMKYLKTDNVKKGSDYIPFNNVIESRVGPSINKMNRPDTKINPISIVNNQSTMNSQSTPEPKKEPKIELSYKKTLIIPKMKTLDQSSKIVENKSQQGNISSSVKYDFCRRYDGRVLPSPRPDHNSGTHAEIKFSEITKNAKYELTSPNRTVSQKYDKKK